MRSVPETSFNLKDTNLGYWTVLPRKGSNVAIGIIFKADTDSLLKMLPEFITKLKVPLLAIAEVTSSLDLKLLFFKNNRSNDTDPYFNADWVF